MVLASVAWRRIPNQRLGALMAYFKDWRITPIFLSTSNSADNSDGGLKSILFLNRIIIHNHYAVKTL
jgi:hypothetical protein